MIVTIYLHGTGEYQEKEKFSNIHNEKYADHVVVQMFKIHSALCEGSTNRMVLLGEGAGTKAFHEQINGAGKSGSSVIRGMENAYGAFKNAAYTGHGGKSKSYSGYAKNTAASVGSKLGLFVGAAITGVAAAVTGGQIFRAFDRDGSVAKASGYGVDKQARSIVELLCDVNENKKIEKVCLVGFSRGAATAMRVAYYLSKQPGTLAARPVHIFNIDPVPGRSHSGHASLLKLPENIKDYIFTTAIHEDRNNYRPLNETMKISHRLSGANAVNIAALPFPGIHSEQPQCDNITGAVIGGLVKTFLEKHGAVGPIPVSGFSKGPLTKNWTKLDYLLVYDDMLNHPTNKEGKEKKGDTSNTTSPYKSLTYKYGATKKYLSGGGEYERNAHKSNGFFYNIHHEYCFSRLFPSQFDDLNQASSSYGPAKAVISSGGEKALFNSGLKRHANLYHHLLQAPGFKITTESILGGDCKNLARSRTVQLNCLVKNKFVTFG